MAQAKNEWTHKRGDLGRHRADKRHFGWTLLSKYYEELSPAPTTINLFSMDRIFLTKVINVLK
jgi:hypothetical protein